MTQHVFLTRVFLTPVLTPPCVHLTSDRTPPSCFLAFLTPCTPTMPSLTSAHSIRNPGKRVQPIKQRQKVISHAEKQSRALAAAQNKINSDNLQAELNEHFELREETIDRLATKYKKTDKYIRKLICSSTRSKQVRKANLYNAYVHDLFEKEIAGASPVFWVITCAHHVGSGWTQNSSRASRRGEGPHGRRWREPCEGPHL